MPKSKGQPWDRLEGENDEQFALFQLFMKERSLDKVAEVYFEGRKELAFTKDMVRAIAAKYDWRKRRSAYDRWIQEERDRVVTAMVKVEISVIKRDRIKILRRFQKIAEAVAEKVLPVNAPADFKINIGEALAGSKVLQALLDEYRKFEVSNPVESTPAQATAPEILGAQERLMAIIEQRALAESAAEQAPLQ